MSCVCVAAAAAPAAPAGGVDVDELRLLAGCLIRDRSDKQTLFALLLLDLSDSLPV